MITVTIDNEQLKALTRLLNLGIEVERLNLEIYRCLKTNSVDSHVAILEGERFVYLLSHSASGSDS